MIRAARDGDGRLTLYRTGALRADNNLTITSIAGTVKRMRRTQPPPNHRIFGRCQGRSPNSNQNGVDDGLCEQQPTTPSVVVVRRLFAWTSDDDDAVASIQI
jgi:hypothetical protein